MYNGVMWMQEWDPSFSAGETITLEGLSLLILGAERHFGVIPSGWDLVVDEAEALLSVLHRYLDPYFDGKKTISSMRANESSHWRENEWQGFYFEERAREILAETHPVPEVGGPKRKYGNTDFAYVSARRVWDMKVHSSTQIYLPSNYEPKPTVSMMLYDAQSVYECIAEQGLGFIILNGQATYDETGQFDSWQRQFKSDGIGNTQDLVVQFKPSVHA